MENPRPRRLRDKAQGFGYAIKELKAFQVRNSSESKKVVNDRIEDAMDEVAERRVVRISSRISLDKWDLDLDSGGQATSTPASTPQSSDGDKWLQKDNSKTLNESFLDSHASYVQDSQSEISTLNKGYVAYNKDSVALDSWEQDRIPVHGNGENYPAGRFDKAGVEVELHHATPAKSDAYDARRSSPPDKARNSYIDCAEGRR